MWKLEETDLPVHDAIFQEHYDKIAQFGLQQNLQEIKERGYTIIRNSIDQNQVIALRNKCLEILSEGNQIQAGLLLYRGKEFEQAVCNQKMLAIAEILCGRGFILSKMETLAKGQMGTDDYHLNIPFHTDYALIPHPFPPFVLVAMATFVLDDWTENAGGSVVIESTHKLRHQYLGNSNDDNAVTITAPAGSIIMWDGAIHHKNSPRFISGKRVTIHSTFNRMYVRPLEDYSNLPENILRRNSKQFASLLGHNDPFEYSNFDGTHKENFIASKEYFLS